MTVAAPVQPTLRLIAGAEADLAAVAAGMLRALAGEAGDDTADSRDERNVWRPDSWLLQRSWEMLADAGLTDSALHVAQLAVPRAPLSLYQSLYRTLLSDAETEAHCTQVVAELARQRAVLMHTAVVAPATHADALLYAAAAAAHCREAALAFTFLERLDQLPHVWHDLLLAPERRTLLARTLAALPPHPLTTALIAGANRLHGEEGVILVQAIASTADTETRHGSRILAHCVEAMRYASLTTMHSHRAAVSVLARAGQADAVLRQLGTIATIQEARRESGLALRKNDQQLLRQVKRPQANADVDFQVYTLQEAIRTMPVRAIDRDQRIALAKQLAMLGMQSDGWTAAGAAATLVDLGALKLAEDVVDHVAETDPTRSEGAISLVRSLLNNGEEELAAVETTKALAWAQRQEGKNAERATVWGLAEVYLDYGRPDKALTLLEQRRAPSSFWARLRTGFRTVITDDELRDDRLRLRAQLQFGDTGREVDALVTKLCGWAPHLLDGEALANFFIDGLLEPLLDGNRLDHVWGLLPQLETVLAVSSGDRHATHVRRVAELLVQYMTAAQVTDDVYARLERFLRTIWTNDSRRSIWQLVHGIEGALPLLLALEGPGAIVDLATAVATEGESWGGDNQ